MAHDTAEREKAHGGRREWKQTPLDAMYLKRVNELFKATGWKQEELARRMSKYEFFPITKQTAFDSIRGQTQPTIGRLYTFENVFAVSYSYLLGEDSTQPTLDEHIAYRWNQLTKEQKATVTYLIDSIVSANANDGIGQVMREFATA